MDLKLDGTQKMQRKVPASYLVDSIHNNNTGTSVLVRQQAVGKLDQ